MKINSLSKTLALLVTLCFLFCYSNAAPLDGQKIQHASKFKRSPFLRLDELCTKIYLAKNKLGGGLIDPLEM